MKIMINVSPGEVLDKLSILEIKEERLPDEAKRDAVIAEACALEEAIGPFNVFDTVGIQELYDALDTVNRQLWNIEERLRSFEKAQTFNIEFTNLARQVYKLNDERAKFKREINSLLGSEMTEIKTYV